MTILRFHFTAFQDDQAVFQGECGIVRLKVMLTKLVQHKTVYGYVFGTYPLAIILNFRSTVVGFDRVSMQIQYHEVCVSLDKAAIIPIVHRTYLIPHAELIL